MGSALYSYFRAAMIAGFLLFGMVVYVVYHYSRSLPDYSSLTDYHPPLVTRIYSSNGKLIEEYALQHRVFVPISNVPRSLVEAFIAAEDKNFFEHPGIDVVSIARAAVNNVVNVLQGRRVEGGSTITQQVVKNFLVGPERSFERKIKEAILAYMISKAFTKEQILELYLNQIFLGKGSYGVAVAALNYFNKSVEELTLEESAFLAGLPQAPSGLNPEKNYEKAKGRRDYVITRMLEDGYISESAAKAAIKEPLKLSKRPKQETLDANYYADHVRQQVIDMFGKEYFYTAGLTIITCMDEKLQEDAQNSLQKGIRNYDQWRGFRGPIANIKTDKWYENLNNVPVPDSILNNELAVILEVSDLQAKIGLKSNKISVIPLAEMKWGKSNLKSVKDMLKVGDVVVVEALKNNYKLSQIPQVNGGLIVMHPSSGKVLASVGGYDYSVNKFDRVTSALRQPGSLIKPFVYLTALENNILPTTLFKDDPISISQGAGMPSWRPKNYKGDSLGTITMRKGLEKSRNLVTVRVAQMVGLRKIAKTIHRFGINQNPPIFYSMVLGALDTTLEKMATAYGIIANNGEKITPHYIEMIKDRKGKVLYRRDNRPCPTCSTTPDSDVKEMLPPVVDELEYRRITDDASNYQVLSMLKGVVERGTSVRAKVLNKVIAGKTGTSNESKSTWFIGFTPQILVGTYIGYDKPRTLGKSADGSRVALPIFIDFMQTAAKDTPSIDFKVPNSIKLVSTNPANGSPMSGPGSIIEAFKVEPNKVVDYPDDDSTEPNIPGSKGSKSLLDIFDLVKPATPEIDDHIKSSEPEEHPTEPETTQDNQSDNDIFDYIPQEEHQQYSSPEIY